MVVEGSECSDPLELVYTTVQLYSGSLQYHAELADSVA